jgi:hypothetical protein
MENVEHIDEKRNGRKMSRKTPKKAIKYMSKDSVKINRRKLGCEVQGWVQVRLDKIQLRASVNRLIKQKGPYKARNV